MHLSPAWALLFGAYRELSLTGVASRCLRAGATPPCNPGHFGLARAPEWSTGAKVPPLILNRACFRVYAGNHTMVVPVHIGSLRSSSLEPRFLVSMPRMSLPMARHIGQQFSSPPLCPAFDLGISRAKLPLYLGFFEFVHTARKRGKALLHELIELLAT